MAKSETKTTKKTSRKSSPPKVGGARGGTSTLARLDQGTVQLTLHISWSKTELKRNQIISELAKNVEVPGFRKGKAPIDKAIGKLNPDKIIEDTLNSLLPEAYTTAIKEHSIIPAMYPNFELISAKEGQDWQIRATTAELPKFEVKGYKEKIRSKAKSASGGKKSTKKLSREEKEQLVIATLLEAYDVEPPTLLVENEVQSRLSALLERLEKLGLQLENYLLSIGKTIDTLREEYNSQASAGIKLDLILGKISADEKVEVSDKEIEDFIHASEGGKPEQSHAHTHTNEQKIIVRTMLKKRKILDSLASLL